MNDFFPQLHVACRFDLVYFPSFQCWFVSQNFYVDFCCNFLPEFPPPIIDNAKIFSGDELKKKQDEAALIVKTCYWWVVFYDELLISPYNINTSSSRQVMRRRKIINKGISPWSTIKFSQKFAWQALKENLYFELWTERLYVLSD